jgi:hypothetical protein
LQQAADAADWTSFWFERDAETLQQWCDPFDVSLPYAKKIRQQFLHTGKMERVPLSRYGPAAE